MKLEKKIRVLSFVLVILVVVLCLPLGATTVSAAGDETEAREVTVDNSVIGEETGEWQSETEEVSQEETEEETEIYCEEYEIENSAIIAPPMTEIGDSVDVNASQP